MTHPEGAKTDVSASKAPPPEVSATGRALMHTDLVRFLASAGIVMSHSVEMVFPDDLRFYTIVGGPRARIQPVVRRR